MATTVAIPKTRTAEQPPRAQVARQTANPDNDRDETPARFVIVVMMPLVILALVAAIVYWLSLPLH